MTTIADIDFSYVDLDEVVTLVEALNDAGYAVRFSANDGTATVRRENDD